MCCYIAHFESVSVMSSRLGLAQLHEIANLEWRFQKGLPNQCQSYIVCKCYGALPA